MGEKKKKIYHALVEGATTGLTDKALFKFVQDKCPKTSSKNIVRASLLALSDPDLRDANILNTIYALAIKHRLDALSPDDHDDDDDATDVPQISTKDVKKPVRKAVKKTAAKPGKQDGEAQA